MANYHYCGGVGDDRENFTLELEGEITLTMKLENKNGIPVSVRYCYVIVKSLPRIYRLITTHDWQGEGINSQLYEFMFGITR